MTALLCCRKWVVCMIKFLKISSHQIKLGLKMLRLDRPWWGLKMVKRFLNVASIFLNLSSPSGIATCNALHTIRWLRRQYCRRRSHSDKYTLYFFSEFSSVFRDIFRGSGLFHVTGTYKHLCYIIWKCYLPPFVSALKGIKFLFAACQKGLATICKIRKIHENRRVLHAVIKFLPLACKRVADCL